jgi:hypothetical protein
LTGWTPGRAIDNASKFQSPCEIPFQVLSVISCIISMVLKHLVLEVAQQKNGSWTATGIGDDIFTEGSDLEDLKVNALEAIRAHFFDDEADKFEVRLVQVVSQFVFAA